MVTTVSRRGLTHRASSASSPSRRKWGAGLSLPLIFMLVMAMVVCIAMGRRFLMEVSADKRTQEDSGVPVVQTQNGETVEPQQGPEEKRRQTSEKQDVNGTAEEDGNTESDGKSKTDVKSEDDRSEAKKKREKGKKKEQKKKENQTGTEKKRGKENSENTPPQQDKEEDAGHDGESEEAKAEDMEEEPKPQPTNKDEGPNLAVDCDPEEKEKVPIAYSLAMEREIMSVLPPPGFPWFVQRDTLQRWPEEQQKQKENPELTKMTSSSFVPSEHLLQKLEQVMPDDKYERPIPMPYFLSPSRQLVARKAHLDAAHNLPWSDRVQAFEEMMEMVLEILQQVGEGHARFQRLWQGDLPLLFDWDDFTGCGGENNSHPRFTHSRPLHMNADQCPAFPIPSYDAWLNHHQEQNILSREDIDRDIIKYSAEHFPWESKIAKAVWRGTTTGQREFWEGWTWRLLERSRLVLQGLQHPDIFDVGFYMIVQMYNEEEEQQIRNETRLVDRLPFDEFQKWRAIIDIEGNSWSSRFARLMCTNSVIIKITPRNVDYFHDELVPWVHYVPADLDNIVDIVRFVVAEENQQAMQLIVTAANDWCRSKMSANAMATDMLWILLLYAELLDKGDVHWKDSWRQSAKGYYQNYDDIMTVKDYWKQRKEQEEAKTAEKEG